MDHNATSAPNAPPPYSTATQECPKQSTIGDPHIIEMDRVLGLLGTVLCPALYSSILYCTRVQEVFANPKPPLKMLRTQEIDEPTHFAPQPAHNSPVVPVGKKGQYVAFWGTDGKLYYARKPPRWGICLVLLIPLLAFLLIVGLIVGLTQ